MSKFIGDLVVKLVKDSPEGCWELQQPFGYQSDLTGLTFTVPVGFRTDFCSVPRVPGVYDILGDRARMSGTVHDYLYSTQELTRELADQTLRDMLQIDGMSHFEAEEFYLAVRAGGESHW